jgi:hypothetical protein
LYSSLEAGGRGFYTEIGAALQQSRGVQQGGGSETIRRYGRRAVRPAHNAIREVDPMQDYPDLAPEDPDADSVTVRTTPDNGCSLSDRHRAS